MKILNRFFNNDKVECPRCLGKGNVDWDDIKRLNKELKWMPGTCAYCEGIGEVNKSLLEKVSADATYLTTNISSAERDRLIGDDKGAWDRAFYSEAQLDNFIREVGYLYFVGQLDVDQITDFYFLHQLPADIKIDDRADMIDYINHIINLKNTDLV